MNGESELIRVYASLVMNHQMSLFEIPPKYWKPITDLIESKNEEKEEKNGN